MPGRIARFIPIRTRRHPVFACRCQGCGADVRGVVQSPCETYDRIEIPKIEPDVTQVSLYGGVCPGCCKRFKAEPPQGLEPGSPFGPNLRAFVIYLRSVQNIPLARLTTCCAICSASRSARARWSTFCTPVASPSPSRRAC